MGIELVKKGGNLSFEKTKTIAVEEIYVGDSAPTEDRGYKAWIDTSEEAEIAELATKEYVDEAISNIEFEDIDLSEYATTTYVDSAIEKIELTPGPQGEKGEPGEKGADGAPGKDGVNGIDGKDGVDGEDGYTPVKGVDYYTEEEKAALVQDVLAALPAAESVGV